MLKLIDKKIITNLSNKYLSQPLYNRVKVSLIYCFPHVVCSFSVKFLNSVYQRIRTFTTFRQSVRDTKYFYHTYGHIITYTDT